jgi:hypothetical protein
MDETAPLQRARPPFDQTWGRVRTRTPRRHVSAWLRILYMVTQGISVATMCALQTDSLSSVEAQSCHEPGAFYNRAVQRGTNRHVRPANAATSQASTTQGQTVRVRNPVPSPRSPLLPHASTVLGRDGCMRVKHMLRDLRIKKGYPVVSHQ